MGFFPSSHSAWEGLGWCSASQAMSAPAYAANAVINLAAQVTYGWIAKVSVCSSVAAISTYPNTLVRCLIVSFHQGVFVVRFRVDMRNPL